MIRVSWGRPGDGLAWIADNPTWEQLGLMAPYVPAEAVWEAVPISDDVSDREALRGA